MLLPSDRDSPELTVPNGLDDSPPCLKGRHVPAAVSQTCILRTRITCIHYTLNLVDCFYLQNFFFLQYPNQCEAPICTARVFFFRTTLDRNRKYRVPIIHQPAFQLLYLLFEHSFTGHSAFLTVLIALFPSPVLYCPCSWHRSDIHCASKKIPEQLLTGPCSLALPLHPDGLFTSCLFRLLICRGKDGHHRPVPIAWLETRDSMEVPRRTMEEVALEGGPLSKQAPPSNVTGATFRPCPPSPREGCFPINTLLFAPTFSHPSSYILFKHLRSWLTCGVFVCVPRRCVLCQAP